VAIDEVQDPVSLSRSARFAALIRKDAASILTLYRRSIGSCGPTPAELSQQDDIGASGATLIAKLVEKVYADDVHIGVPHSSTMWQDKDDPVNGIQAEASTPAATASFFTSTVTVLARHVETDPSLLRSFVAAILALNECLACRVGQVPVAHTQQMLTRIYRARLDERRRVARELHDRLGEELSVALRRLELSELIPPDPADPATARASLARKALVQAMEKVRLITTDLRQDPVISLEQALRHYPDAVRADTDMRLQFHGSEHWASAAVIDEAYLIIREAIRNALDHAAPRLVTITVNVDPHCLRALIEDDGRGFTLTPPTSGNAGLASMRERAFLIGGRLHINSIPGRGTQVELIVPLPGPSRPHHGALICGHA
jgi:signal transduction histidine kinase